MTLDPDPRWHPASHGESEEDVLVSRQIRSSYPQLGSVRARLAYSSVHEVIDVRAGDHRFALKVYRSGIRSERSLDWEIGLQRHLRDVGVPVPRLIEGRAGFVQPIELGGVTRQAVLSEWAPGAKPKPAVHTYRLLGALAARIHAGSDSYRPRWHRPGATYDSEVVRHLARLRPVLELTGRWRDAQALADSLDRFLRSHRLERGICHNDLTLDNIHIDGDQIHVFDFDSSSEHWRAWEGQGVYAAGAESSAPWWESWTAAYREVRPLPSGEELAVPWFHLMAHFENAAWRFGLTPTSVGPGPPAEELGPLVDSWRAWARERCHE